MTRALLLFVVWTILWKCLWTWRNKRKDSFARAFWWVFLLILALVMPIIFVKALMQHWMLGWCEQMNILLPTFLTSLLLWIYWNWDCCSSNGCGCGTSCESKQRWWASASQMWIAAMMDEDDVDPDKLTKIEWIGPKIQEVLYSNWVKTFRTLSQIESGVIKNMLSEAWPQFIQHDPTTWPMQASLAASWRWDKLKKRQDELDGWRV